MSTGKIFNGTCVEVDLLTCAGDYMYPCSCSHYYTCANKDMLLRPCGTGRAWDYKTGNCNHKDDVIYSQPCEEKKNAWLRCNTTDNPLTEERLQTLKALCTNTTIPPPPTTTPAPTGSTEAATGGDGLNAGVVIGLIVAGAALTIIIIAVVICLLKRQKANKLKRANRPGTFAANPEYFESGMADDPYAIIPDNLVKSKPASDTFPRDQAPLPPTEQNGDAVYDNSAERANTDNFGYTATLTRDTNETPYTHLGGANGYERSGNMNTASGTDAMSGGQTENVVVAGFGVDTLGKSFSEIPGTNDAGISIEVVSDPDDPDFDAPNYHKLQKTSL